MFLLHATRSAITPKGLYHPYVCSAKRAHCIHLHTTHSPQTPSIPFHSMHTDTQSSNIFVLLRVLVLVDIDNFRNALEFWRRSMVRKHANVRSLVT